MLRTVPKGQPIALYLLTSKLQMVQAFSDDPDKLMQVGRKPEAQPVARLDHRSRAATQRRSDRLRSP